MTIAGYYYIILKFAGYVSAGVYVHNCRIQLQEGITGVQESDKSAGKE